MTIGSGGNRSNKFFLKTPKNRLNMKVFLPLFILIFSFFYTSSFAQTTPLKSRLAVTTTEVKTNVWVSDFPKNSSVLIFDAENNLLAITSTNDFGAAFLSFPKNIVTTIYAKTINGEIMVSNKAKTNDKAANSNVATADSQNSDKA